MLTVGGNFRKGFYFAKLLIVAVVCVNYIECFCHPTPSARSTTSGGRRIEDDENNINHIKSIIIDSNNNTKSQQDLNRDASTIPIKQIIRHNNISCCSISYSSDFVSSIELDASKYEEFTTSRHTDCINLFDYYSTNLIRCEKIDESSLNIRWELSWTPSGSTWLYNLADLVKWQVNKKRPDPSVISKFSWIAVFDMFRNAFVTGNITLPISCVEGCTVLTMKQQQQQVQEEHSVVSNSTDTNADYFVTISIKESIDLVLEADKNRLQNRRVAQELASWIDVSRRPPNFDVDDWAGKVSRILSSVPGAGALDFDPNENDAEGIMALVLFGIVSIAVLGVSFQFFAPELVGGTGTIPVRCDDAAILEFGSGYLSECFGPFGDPTL